MTQLKTPASPRLPDPGPAGVNAGYMVGFINVLRLYINQISNLFQLLFGPLGGVYVENPHAMLMSNQDQTNPSITGANTVSYNQSVISQGVEVRSSNQIWFESAGQYLVTARLQVANRGAAAAEFEVWLGSSGSNYALSNTRFDIPARKSISVWSHIVPTIPFIFTVTNPQTQYLTVQWWAGSTDVVLEHYAAGTSPTRPEIPSVIMTVNFVSRLP